MPMRAPSKAREVQRRKDTCRAHAAVCASTWQSILSIKSAPSSRLTCERRCGRKVFQAWCRIGRTRSGGFEMLCVEEDSRGQS
jgi:hypothetical protein